MNLSDAYALLNVKDSNGDDEIKAAYRKLVIIHHPDKGGSAEEFVKITEAYEKIQAERGQPILMSLLNMGFEKIFNVLITAKKKNDLTLHIKTNVDLQSLYTGMAKRLSYSRFVDGVKTLDETFIDLANFKGKYVFEKKGDACNGVEGDLIVNVAVTNEMGEEYYYDHEISGPNLHVDKKITLKDYLLGCTVYIQLPDKTSHACVVPPLKENLSIVRKGMGFPSNGDFGDLFIKIALDLKVKETFLEDETFKDKIRQYF